nr:MAG TPA: hypothetical protein [Caudoviricetes sp.]
MSIGESIFSVLFLLTFLVLSFIIEIDGGSL